MNNYALIGFSKAGKTTVANKLVENYGYQRCSFATPLKLEVANMFDKNDTDSCYECGNPYKLEIADQLAFIETNKEKLRPLLQAYGQAKRDIDGIDYWVNQLLYTIDPVLRSGGNVVIDDCRYLNEATKLHSLGFKIIRVVNYRSAPSNSKDIDSLHISEREHLTIANDYLIRNNGSLADLDQFIEALAH